MMRIQLIADGDVITLVDNRLDRHGDAWIREDGISGLYGATKPKETASSIPQQDGAYWPSRLTASPRTITIDCVTHRGSTIDAIRLIDRINALTYRQVTLLVEDASGRRTLTG